MVDSYASRVVMIKPTSAGAAVELPSVVVAPAPTTETTQLTIA